eukprot:71800_1
MAVQVISIVFTLLLLNSPIGNCSLTHIATSIGASLLKEMMFQTYESSTNIAESENYVKSLPFTKFNERSVASYKQGVKISDLSEFGIWLKDTYNIPDTAVKEIKGLKFADKSETILRDFIYSSTGDSFYTFARIAAVKVSDTKIDIAYWFYNTAFQLAPKRIERSKKVKLLGFITIGKKKWTEEVPRELNDDQIEHLRNVFHKKCVTELKRLAPPSLINAPTIRNKEYQQFIGHKEL